MRARRPRGGAGRHPAGRATSSRAGLPESMRGRPPTRSRLRVAARRLSTRRYGRSTSGSASLRACSQSTTPGRSPSSTFQSVRSPWAAASGIRRSPTQPGEPLEQLHVVRATVDVGRQLSRRFEDGAIDLRATGREVGSEPDESAQPGDDSLRRHSDVAAGRPNDGSAVQSRQHHRAALLDDDRRQELGHPSTRGAGCRAERPDRGCLAVADVQPGRADSELREPADGSLPNQEDDGAPVGTSPAPADDDRVRSPWVDPRDEWRAVRGAQISTPSPTRRLRARPTSPSACPSAAGGGMPTTTEAARDAVGPVTTAVSVRERPLLASASTTRRRGDRRPRTTTNGEVLAHAIASLATACGSPSPASTRTTSAPRRAASSVTNQLGTRPPTTAVPLGAPVG